MVVDERRRRGEVSEAIDVFVQQRALVRDPLSEEAWHLKSFQKSNRSTGKTGEHDTFVNHIITAAHQLARPDTLVIFSGGRTDPEIAYSESESYAAAFQQLMESSIRIAPDVAMNALESGRWATEQHATDSYQNLLFSILEFRRVVGAYPERVTVVTHKFKITRFIELHAPAIRWPAERIRVIGIDPEWCDEEERFSTIKLEMTMAVEPFRADPHGIKDPLAAKRLQRQWDPATLEMLAVGLEPQVAYLLSWSECRIRILGYIVDKSSLKMADLSTCPPLTRASVQEAHKLITPHIHRTPVLTCATLTRLASTPQDPSSPLFAPCSPGAAPASPKINLLFKCENTQRIGAFKARGAFHALSRLRISSPELLEKGVITHSSGNHAQALALAAREFGVKATIVMPEISTTSKIEGTKSQGAEVVFSGSTSVEREAVVNKIIEERGLTLVPPYDHPDIILGQGTLALELEEQAKEILNHYRGPGKSRGGCSFAAERQGTSNGVTNGTNGHPPTKGLDAVIAPCGGGGMLSGVATALSGTGIRVFAAEPSFQGGDDAKRGVAAGKRVDSVKTLTIADGLRTPLGDHTWKIISDKEKVQGLYSVTEEQIKAAMKLMLERAKIFIEPSSAVGVAVALYNEEFRAMVEREAGEEGWDIGVVLTGGNTTVEAIAKLFG
ncbi:pyridoxal-phosphate dependent enzyme-domain-containing protein [Elsinoe ampelina]|uniref:Pyridoxal-phosphate dependent enzyme-domain-containing protein n=1 Tax=Elsinoe ampelina TaxID=302913 RepID=A0A6A6GEG7_9PEZI|nr:pyridoxal-phosphate dependent enzyme-domain-containing protein [Elsinoe ampelina]